MNQIKIGKFIARLRHEKQLTQEEFGNKIGVSSKTISRWENGNYMPDISLLEIIAKELDITISELLKGERIDKENLVNESNKDILNLLKSKNKEKRKYIKFIIIGAIVLVIGIAIAIIQTIRLNNEIEEDAITLIDGIYTSEKGAKITNDQLTILRMIHFILDKEELAKLTQEDVNLLVNSYYSQLQIAHWYGYNMIIDSVSKKINVYDAEISVYKVTQKYLPFTNVIGEKDVEEYYCALGRSKYGTLISSQYKDGKCIIDDTICSRLKEEGTTTKLNLDYCN